MNKVLKMDYKGQTTVLSVIFILVGMMFLVPEITEKAVGRIEAVAKGECGSPAHVHACQFTWVTHLLKQGAWVQQPTNSGTLVKWATRANGETPFTDNEEGSVTYKVDKDTMVLHFYNPAIGKNSCGISKTNGAPFPPHWGKNQYCNAGSGMSAHFEYILRGL